MIAWLAREDCSFTHRRGVRPVGRARDLLTSIGRQPAEPTKGPNLNNRLIGSVEFET